MWGEFNMHVSEIIVHKWFIKMCSFVKKKFGFWPCFILLIQTGLWNYFRSFFFVVFRYNSNQLLVFFVLPLSALLFLVLVLISSLQLVLFLVLSEPENTDKYLSMNIMNYTEIKGQWNPQLSPMWRRNFNIFYSNGWNMYKIKAISLFHQWFQQLVQFPPPMKQTAMI